MRSQPAPSQLMKWLHHYTDPEARGRKLFTLGLAVRTPFHTIQLNEDCLWAVLAHWNAIIAPCVEFGISCPSVELVFENVMELMT